MQQMLFAQNTHSSQDCCSHLQGRRPKRFALVFAAWQELPGQGIVPQEVLPKLILLKLSLPLGAHSLEAGQGKPALVTGGLWILLEAVGAQ